MEHGFCYYSNLPWREVAAGPSLGTEPILGQERRETTDSAKLLLRLQVAICMCRAIGPISAEECRSVTKSGANFGHVLAHTVVQLFHSLCGLRFGSSFSTYTNSTLQLLEISTLVPQDNPIWHIGIHFLVSKICYFTWERPRGDTAFR